MRKPPPTETNKQLKGPECEGGAWQGEREGFQEKKIVKWATVTIRNSPFPQSRSLSLSSCTICLSWSFLSDVSEYLRAEETRTEVWGRGAQQQQRKAGWLALPAQKGEENSGHVELSYVLTCPSPPLPPPIWTFSLTWGESGHMQTGEWVCGCVWGVIYFCKSPGSCILKGDDHKLETCYRTGHTQKHTHSLVCRSLEHYLLFALEPCCSVVSLQDTKSLAAPPWSHTRFNSYFSLLNWAVSVIFQACFINKMTWYASEVSERDLQLMSLLGLL